MTVEVLARRDVQPARSGKSSGTPGAIRDVRRDVAMSLGFFDSLDF